MSKKAPQLEVIVKQEDHPYRSLSAPDRAKAYLTKIQEVDPEARQCIDDMVKRETQAVSETKDNETPPLIKLLKHTPSYFYGFLPAGIQRSIAKKRGEDASSYSVINGIVTGLGGFAGLLISTGLADSKLLPVKYTLPLYVLSGYGVLSNLLKFVVVVSSDKTDAIGVQ